MNSASIAPLSLPPHANPASADALAGLRDIHLPEAIGWWPPAPGWWLLLGLIIVLIAAIYAWMRWRAAQQSTQDNTAVIFSNAAIIHAALLEFDAIEQQSTSDDCDEHGQQSVRDVSQLLRRSAMQLNSNNPDANVMAGLTGTAWLEWLDSRWHRTDFTQGAGQLLMHAPYRSSNMADDDLSDLFALSRAWLEHQR